MKRRYLCSDCGVGITIEAKHEKDLPKLNEKILCQKCDPDFSSLRDNKHHGKTKVSPTL